MDNNLLGSCNHARSSFLKQYFVLKGGFRYLEVRAGQETYFIKRAVNPVIQGGEDVTMAGSIDAKNRGHRMLSIAGKQLHIPLRDGPLPDRTWGKDDKD